MNKNRTGMGFSSKNGKGKSLKSKSTMSSYHDVLCSGGYLYPTDYDVNAIEEDDIEKEMPNYVTHGVRVKNWVTIDIPFFTHISK